MNANTNFDHASGHQPDNDQTTNDSQPFASDHQDQAADMTDHQWFTHQMKAHGGQLTF